MKYGFIGYSTAGFDQDQARRIIRKIFDSIEKDSPQIVSGLTNIGIPGLVYQEATRRGLTTVGIACEKANEYECFPVDKKIIHGKEWGEESKIFLDSIDFLIKIGGGTQSREEFDKFPGHKYEFKL